MTVLRPFGLCAILYYPGEPVPEWYNQSGFTGARDTSPHTDNHSRIPPLFTGQMPFLEDYL